ncbi:VpsF family polysaccharide biosynthesis protein [Alsobacter sp. SYSU BS001988]
MRSESRAARRTALTARRSALASAGLAASPGLAAPWRAEDDRPLVAAVLAWGVGAALLSRFVLSENLLNAVIDYSSDGGSVLEKIHVGTYLGAGLLALALLTTRIALLPAEVRILRQFGWLLAVIAALTAVVVLAGNSVSAGFLVDTYVSSALACALMFVLPPGSRRRIGDALLIFMALSSLVAIAEKAVGLRLLPYPYVENGFRPTGLTSHPLVVGLFNAGSIAFVMATRWPGWAKAAAMLLLVVAAFAAGARTGALLAAGVALVSALTMPLANPDPAQRLKTRGLILLGLVCLVPIALPVMAQLGLLERFITDGYVDDSANARVEIYRIFGLVDWRDILLGADPLWIKKLAFEKLGFEFIESPVVMFVFQFGALGAAALFCTILLSLWRLAAGSDWRATLGVVAFLLCALSNNTLSSKNQAIVMMVVLCLAYRRDDAPGRGWPA